MTSKLTPLLKMSIDNLKEAKDWIDELVEQDLMFHFEDDPAEIVGNSVSYSTDGAATCHSFDFFTPEDCKIIRKRVAELYKQDWGKVLECPIGYALEALEELEKENA